MNRLHGIALLLFLMSGLAWSQGQNSDPCAPRVTPLPGGRVADLVGEWNKSNVSTIDFVNPSTGAHADPNGVRLNVRFFPDGHYKLGWLKY